MWAPELNSDCVFGNELDEVGVDLDFVGEVIKQFFCEALCKMRVLGGVVVEIYSQERDDVRDGLYFILRMSQHIGLIQVQLAQIQVKIVFGRF